MEIKVRLIDEAYLKERFPIPTDVDDQNILRAIRIAQSVHLIDVLGSCLYEGLESQIIAGTIADEGNEHWVDLLILSKDYLLYRTVSILNDVVIAGDSMVGSEEGERNSFAATADGLYSEYSQRIRNHVIRTDALWAIAAPTVCKGYNQFETEETGVATFYPTQNPSSC